MTEVGLMVVTVGLTLFPPPPVPVPLEEPPQPAMRQGKATPKQAKQKFLEFMRDSLSCIFFSLQEK
jgi:hypothetical protein